MDFFVSSMKHSVLIKMIKKEKKRNWGGGRGKGRNKRRTSAGKLGLRVIATEVTTLHHEQFVDGIMNGCVQALRQ